MFLVLADQVANKLAWGAKVTGSDTVFDVGFQRVGQRDIYRDQGSFFVSARLAGKKEITRAALSEVVRAAWLIQGHGASPLKLGVCNGLGWMRAMQVAEK
ncbi:MAG: hypothetical protein WCC26_03895 [Terracidiphilus sp.]